jgi:hypothetical protein
MRRMTFIGLGLATLVVGLFFGAGPLLRAFQTALAPRVQVAMLLGPVVLLAALVAAAALLDHHRRTTEKNLTHGRSTATNFDAGLSELGERILGGPVEQDTEIIEPELHRVSREVTITALALTVDDVNAKAIESISYQGRPVAQLPIPHGFRSVSAAYAFHRKHRRNWAELVNQLTRGRDPAIKQVVVGVGISSGTAPLAYDLAVSPAAQVNISWIVMDGTSAVEESKEADQDINPEPAADVSAMGAKS